MSRIHTDPDFEPRIADWLEAGPDHAPREVLATVMAAFPSIPQRRATSGPRRSQTMTRFAYLGAAAAIVLATVAGGLLLVSGRTGPQVVSPPGPSPTAATSPTVTPEASPAASPPHGFTEPYASELYGYRLVYPATWNLGPGAHANRPDYVPDLAEGRADFFGDTMSGHGLMITSAPVSSERPDLSAWSRFIAEAVPLKYGSYLHISTCEQSTRALTVDGEPANEVDFMCPDHDWLWVTAIHAGRAYQIAWLDDGGFDPEYLRPFLDMFLQTFTFAD